MPGLQDFRAKYPQYDDLPDAELATALHGKYYSDMPQEEYFNKLGLTVEQAAAVAPTPTVVTPPATPGRRAPEPEGYSGADFETPALPAPGTQATFGESLATVPERAVLSASKYMATLPTFVQEMAADMGSTALRTPELGLEQGPSAAADEATITPERQQQMEADLRADPEAIRRADVAAGTAIDLEAARPDKPEGFPGLVAGTIAESSLPMLAGAAVGVVSPFAGITLATAGGASMEGAAALQETQDIAHSLRVASYEALGEFTGMKAILKPAKTFLRKMRNSIAVNMGEEAATEFAQGVDERISQQDMTLGEIVQDATLWHQIAVAAAAGGTTVAIVTPAIAAAERSAEGAVDRRLEEVAARETDLNMMRRRSPDDIVRELLSPLLPPVREGVAPEAGRAGVNLPNAAAVDTVVGQVEPGASAGSIASRIVLAGITSQGIDPSSDVLARQLLAEGDSTWLEYGTDGNASTLFGPNNIRRQAREIDDVVTVYSTQPSMNRVPYHSKSAEPGAVSVLGPVDEALAQDVGQLVKKWLDILLPKRPATVISFGQMGGRRPLGRANVFDDGQLSVEIDLERISGVAPEDMQAINLAETLAHEVFHLIGPSLLRQSPQNMRNAVLLAWRTDVENALEMKPREFEANFRGTAWQATTELSGLSMGNKSLADLLALGNMSRVGRHVRYLLSFDEWMAHNGERVLAGQVYGWSRQMRKFMQQAYSKWRTLFGLYRSTAAPVNPTFKKFMDYHIALAREERQATELALPEPQTTDVGVEETTGGAESQRMIDFITRVNPTAIGQKAKAVLQWGLSGDRNADAFGREMDKWSWWQRMSFTLIQVAKANLHIKELYDPQGHRAPGETVTRFGYLDYVYKFNNEQMFWASRADERLRQWRKLSSDENENMIRFMYQQRAEGKYFDLQDPAVLQRWKLTPESIELYGKINDDFLAFIGAIEEARVNEAMRRLALNPFMTTEIAAIRKTFAEMRKVPYVPEIRFGRWVVRAVATRDITVDGKRIKAGSTIERQHAEYSVQQAIVAGQMRRTYPGHIIKTDTLPEGLETLIGMPRALLDGLKLELQLTEDQRKALDDYIYRTAPSQSFVRRLIKRMGVKGFSFDLQRAYAQYFQHGAKHLSRIRYGTDLTEAVEALHQTAGVVDTAGPLTQDSNKRRQIANYAGRHLSHLMAPTNDWAAARATIAISYLAGMMRTAVANLTQPVFTTYPNLADEYGDSAAVAEIFKAYRDSYKVYHALKPMTLAQEAIITKWVQGAQLTPAENRYVTKWSGLEANLRDALLRAQSENIIDQSQAMELAAISEGNWMYKFRASSELGYYARSGAQALMVPFQLAEKLNRRVSFVSAYRLAIKAGLNESTAYLKAADAVRTTQFEYSKTFRPELLRGKKGLVFMFMQFPLSSMHFATNGYSGNVASWQWRWWALMLMSGGLMGLPLAENLIDLAEWALVKAFPNKKINVKYEMKKLLKEFSEKLYMSPDLFMHGISRYGFGILPTVDMSGSMSMGRLVPATDVPLMIAEGADWSDAVTRAVTEAGGATSTLVMRLLQGMASNEPDEWRRAERAFPMSLGQHVSAALRWYARGAETDRSGAKIAEFDTNDPWHMVEIAAKAAGFTPRRINERREQDFVKRDFARFYEFRRRMLLNELDDAMLHGDKHAKDQAIAAIRRYNKEAGSKAYLITGEQIQQSVQNRKERRARIERGRGANDREEVLRREYERGRL